MKTIFGINDEITFGQYEGRTVRWVLRHDPDYLGWLLDESDRFDLDEEAEAALDVALCEAIDWGDG